MFRYPFVLLVLLWGVSQASAASWADTMFEELSKDFGSVPRGPSLSHVFRFKNNLTVPVHINSVRVSCGCVTATPLNYDIAPGQTSAIQAQMDTRRFAGIKTVTIYLQLDRPQWEEVRLWVQANSRDDIAIAPETFALGSVKRGSEPSSTLTVTLWGSSQWRIMEIQRESNYVETAIKEVRRNENEATYQFTAKLRSDTPVGKWFTDVWLVTNNPALPRVRVPLNVEIEPALSISPSTLALGEVMPGAETERKVIVRGAKPFRITQVKGADDQLIVRDTTTESKAVHILTVKLKAKEPGEFSRLLRVVTDLPEEGEIEFQAKGTVVSQE